MSYIPSLPMRAGFTYKIGYGPTVSINSRPRTTVKGHIWDAIIALYNRSDSHRKAMGHLLFIAIGIIAAIIEISYNFTPLALTITQFIVPSIVQELFDFAKKL